MRGARILATLAPFADEIAVYPALPLPSGADAYALSFAIPLDTPGLLFLCGDSASSPGADPFDRPLSGRFDEQDAVVISMTSLSPITACSSTAMWRSTTAPEQRGLATT